MSKSDDWHIALYPQVEMFNIEDMIRELNPKYLDEEHGGSRSCRKVNDIVYSEIDGRLYIIYAGTYLFYSDDHLHTLHEVKEINYFAGDLVSGNLQKVAYVVETLLGTMLVIGCDSRTSLAAQDAEGVVWRKERGSAWFKRTSVTRPAWEVAEDSGEVTAGYFSEDHRPMVAFTNYTLLLHYSLDDGLTWQTHDFSNIFKLHCHGVYLPKNQFHKHKARLWVTGGDDFDGQGGIAYADTLGPQNELRGITHVFPERPGYRLVGITGNGKKVFFANESAAGGMLAISDDSLSVSQGAFEYILGRNRLDYHQFRSLIITDDGLLFSGTDSYPRKDTPHKGQGGYLYISRDEGATFMEIPTSFRWITGAAYDGSSFWVAGTGNDFRPGPNLSRSDAKILKVPKPSPFADLSTDYIVKALYVDCGTGSEHLALKPGEKSMWVDLAAYRSIVLSVETHKAGQLVVEASPFLTDPNYVTQGDIPGWYDAETITFETGERKQILLSEETAHNRLFRVRNASPEESIEVKHIVFIGRR